ncbi:transposase [Streptomyces sp. NPDC006602]|uniref:transposase n=1 Tax=Streptomyces sp. NPDC006602 TaxID=3364751 RepID=UPI0036A587EB
MSRGDLTDAQWAVLEPLMPQGVKSGRPPVHTKRQLINGIRFRTRTGIPWRDLPERYGPWETAYGLFRRWQRDGTWHRIFEQFQARADAGPDHLGRLRGLNDRPGPPARGRCPQEGELQVEPPGGPAYASASPSGSTAGHYEVVARFWGAMPTGVTVSRRGRIFVNFPAGATTSRSPSPNCGAGSRWPTPTPR